MVIQIITIKLHFDQGYNCSSSVNLSERNAWHFALGKVWDKYYIQPLFLTYVDMIPAHNS